MYGTWNRLNDVAVARNATSTQITPATGPNEGGTAKVRAKNTGSVKRADEHEPLAGAGADEAAIRPGADHGVDHDVPDLRERDDRARQDRGDSEIVGEEVRQAPGPGRVAKPPVPSDPVAYRAIVRAGRRVVARSGPAAMLMAPVFSGAL